MKLIRVNHLITFIERYGLNLIPPVLSGLIAFSILILTKSLPTRLPLFYSLPWGDSQLANSQQLLIIPAIIILVTLFNLIITWQLHPSQTFFRQVLLLSSLLVTVILVVTFFKIVLIFI